MINWNTVPAFYNDSYTYMEWLGKVTAKVENHEERLITAESEIDQLQEDVQAINETLANHEQRISKNEDDIADIKEDIADIKGDIQDINEDIDALEGTVDALSTWYTDHAADAVSWVEDNQVNISYVLNTTIPALQEQTSENTSAIISMQRDGLVIYQDATSATTSSVTSTRINLSIPYERPTPSENAIDVSAVFTIQYNSIPYTFSVRQIVHGLGVSLPKTYGNQPANSTAEAYIQGTIGVSSGTITLSISRFVLDNVDIAIADLTLLSITSVDLLLYRGKTVTPTSEKEAYQASVRIFTDKTIPLDNRTASIILNYYSKASIDPDLTWADFATEYNTEHPGGLQLDTTSFPDTNLDGKIDAIDATNIQTYYSNASRGFEKYDITDADKFYQWYLDGNPPRWEY